MIFYMRLGDGLHGLDSQISPEGGAADTVCRFRLYSSIPKALFHIKPDQEWHPGRLHSSAPIGPLDHRRRQ